MASKKNSLTTRRRSKRGMKNLVWASSFFKDLIGFPYREHRLKIELSVCCWLQRRCFFSGFEGCSMTSLRWSRDLLLKSSLSHVWSGSYQAYPGGHVHSFVPLHTTAHTQSAGAASFFCFLNSAVTLSLWMNQWICSSQPFCYLPPFTTTHTLH